MTNFSDDNSDEKFQQMREKEAENLARLLSKKYQIPYLDLSRMTIDLDALKLIPEEKAREARVAAFQKTGKKMQIAIESPNPEQTKRAIKELEQRGFSVSLYLVSKTGLQRAWKRYSEVSEYVEASKGIVDVSSEKLEKFIAEAKNIEGLKKIFADASATKQNRRISEILEMVLAGAIASNASDIHLEPQEENTRLRLRLDGVLHDIFIFDPKIYKLVLSRIKLVSGLKLNVRDRAQDGRFSINLQDTEIEIRTSVIPENYGESVVLRILNPKSISGELEDLGMREAFLEKLIKEIGKPHGMILTTGPTGSGKTTTLYACLRKIYRPEIKIVTLEDPIEYHLTGIIQTQVEKEKGYTFASGLRAMLRQDPDVVLIGEIRDAETAKIAIQASLTGHLVLSTLHTNDAAGTIPRLIDLGVNPNTITPALNFAMAQRLARRLCPECKEEYKPNEEEKEIIKRILGDLIEKDASLNPEKVTLWKATGCSTCNNIGYKKRVGIYDGILVDHKIEKLIMEKPSASEIIEATKDQGILSMRQDGVLKAIEGITTLEELRRIIEL